MENRFRVDLRDGVGKTDGITLSNLLEERTDFSPVVKVLRVAGQAGHAAIHGAIQTPISGATELVDKVFGTNLSAHLRLVPELSKSANDFEKGAQLVGSVVGTVVPLLLVHRGVRGASNRIFGSAESAVTGMVSARRLIIESAATGAIVEGMLRPNESPSTADFFQQRLGSALTGAATFAAMTGTALALKGFGGKLEQFKSLRPLASIVQSDIGSLAIAGLPAGFINAELNSITKHGTLASEKDVLLSMGAFAGMGAAFAGAGRLFTKPSPSSVIPPEVQRPIQAPESSGRQGSNGSRFFWDYNCELRNPEMTRTTEGIAEYSEAVRAGGVKSAEAQVVRTKYADAPEFLELSKEVDLLETNFGRRGRGLPLPYDEAEPPASPELGEALSRFAELMGQHGPRSKQAEAFLRTNRSIPEFEDLARECQRLELLFNRNPTVSKLRSWLPSKNEIAPVLIGGVGQRLRNPLAVK